MHLRLSPSPRTSGRAAPGSRVLVVHRVGAIAVALVVLVFGVLGFAGGLDFFSTSGEPILGMSSNGLLSTISVLTAAVLIGAAVRGARIASTVMIVVGSLFLLSALVHLAVLRTDFNVLAFEMTNVFFSIGAGLTLLVLGACSPDQRSPAPRRPVRPPRCRRGPGTARVLPVDPGGFAAERAMREAEIAVVQHVATAEQRRRVEAMAHERTRAGRRRVWMAFDGAR